MLPGPVFNVELMTTARRARYYAIRLAYGMILLFFITQVALPWEQGFSALWKGDELTIGEMAETGQKIFATFATIQGLAVLMLTPALVAGVVADEKRRKTLVYLMASPLTSAEIILGKLFARLLHIGIFLAVGLPIMSLISLFGGVEPLLVVLVYAATMSTACFLASLSILVSTAARRPREANSQVYILALAWLLGPSVVSFTMPMAGGRWAEAYAWIKPANDLLLYSSPFMFVTRAGLNRVWDSILWMVGLQMAYSLGFVLLAILLLRPIVRREGETSRRLGWLFDARRARRFLPRPEVGDDAMLWKERYVSRTSGVIKIAAAIVSLLVIAVLGYATYQFAEPAFVELWNHGYSSNHPYQERTTFNAYLRGMNVLFYVTWCLGIASTAASGLVSEREEDTWTSLVSTPLSGEEILRAKMFGAVWSTRWIGLMLVAFWIIGLASGAVHPLGFVAVAIETVVFVWFVTALGVYLSLTSKTTARAQALTMLTLLVLNGMYMLCCIPMQPDTVLMAAGVTPMIEGLSLLSYQNVDEMLRGAGYRNDRAIESAFTCLIGVVLYGVAALFLTVNAFSSFDAKIDRPMRGNQHRPPADVAKSSTIDEGEEDVA